MTTARACLFAVLFSCALGRTVTAGTISFSGIITQPVDPSNPASNAGLNNIQILDSYTVTLIFPGVITAPGLYDLTGSSLTFTDAAAGASELAFDSISLSITQAAGMDVFSMLACLTTGGGCNSGNQLDANFQIPAASFNGVNVAATGLDQPHPLDLLEDDSVTDIHGSIASYTGPSPAPEPSSIALAGLAAAGLFWIKRRSN